LIYEEVLRPLLFHMSPDAAHEVSRTVFEKGSLWRLLSPFYSYDDERLRASVFGIGLGSPVGLAAGYDKDATMTVAMESLDFDFITIGSVMGKGYLGNRWPRLVRKEKELGLVNAMGLNSEGVDVVARKVKSMRPGKPRIGSIAGYSIEECLRVVELLQPYVDAIEVNTSSPTFKGSWCQHPDKVEELLGRVKRLSSKPTFVKIPPYADETSRNGTFNIAGVSQSLGFGITASNTVPVAEIGLSKGFGGLSGKPLTETTKRIVGDISTELGWKTPIVACGGIFTGRDAFEMIGAGADACEVLTSLIYRGPSTAKRMKMELVEEMKKSGFSSVRDLKGALLRR